MLVRRMLELQLRPHYILTRQAFENAATTIAAAGGITNGFHLLALAREWRVDFTLRDLQAIFRRTPVLCNFARRGKHTMVDLHRIGGTSACSSTLFVPGCSMVLLVTMTGGTLAENVSHASDPPSGHTLIAPSSVPFKPYADMQICFGNLWPHGMVFKVSSF